MANGFTEKEDYKEIENFPFPGMGFVNSKYYRAAEYLSANTNASARGLAKLGAFMANGGTCGGRTIMSEKAWEDFHSGEDRRVDETMGMETNFTNGGVATGEFFIPGFYGWMGFGGSVF